MPYVLTLWDSKAKKDADKKRRPRAPPISARVVQNPYMQNVRAPDNPSGFALRKLEADNSIEDPHKNLMINKDMPDFHSGQRRSHDISTKVRKKVLRIDLQARSHHQIVELERRLQGPEVLDRHVYCTSLVPAAKRPPRARCTVCGFPSGYKCPTCSMKYCSKSCFEVSFFCLPNLVAGVFRGRRRSRIRARIIPPPNRSIKIHDVRSGCNNALRSAASGVRRFLFYPLISTNAALCFFIEITRPRFNFRIGLTILANLCSHVMTPSLSMVA